MKNKNNLLVYLSLAIIDLVVIIRVYLSLTSLNISNSFAYLAGYIGANILQIAAIIYLSVWIYLKTKK